MPVVVVSSTIEFERLHKGLSYNSYKVTLLSGERPSPESAALAIEGMRAPWGCQWSPQNEIEKAAGVSILTVFTD